MPFRRVHRLSKQNPKLKSRKEPVTITEAIEEGSVASVETPEKKNLIKERTPEESRRNIEMEL